MSKSKKQYYDVKSATKKLEKLMRYKEEKLRKEQERIELERKMHDEGTLFSIHLFVKILTFYAYIYTNADTFITSYR